MKRKIGFIVLFLVVLSIKSRANIIYVDSSNTQGFQDGGTWVTAYTSPQIAINNAVAGDTIWVAKGTYKMASNVSLVMKEGVKLFGGFLNTNAVFSQRNFQNNATILKGNGTSVIRNDQNNLTAAAVLDGFIVNAIPQDGNGNSIAISVNGGGMYNNSVSPTISNCIFENANMVGMGGGIYWIGGNGIITNCSFINNIISASNVGGGGLYLNGGTYTIANCNFSNNTINGSFTGSQGAFGAGLYCLNGNCTATNCTFLNNTTTAYRINNNGVSHGGGLYAVGGNYVLNQCVFDGNSTNCGGPNGGESRGGGAYFSGGTITSCIFKNNMSTGSNGSLTTGGGLYCFGSTANNIVSDSFSNNYVTGNSNFTGAGYGGGLYINGDSINVNQCVFKGNIAQYGAGISNNAGSVINNCRFIGNTGSGTASNGAGLYNYNATGSVSNCIFNGNIAPSSLGGAMFNAYTPASFKIINCIFKADSAQKGSGIYNFNSSPLIVNGLFIKNTADSFGAAIYNANSSPKITSCTIVGNTAAIGGSGIYNASNSSPGISNTILWGNYSGIFTDPTSAVLSKYCLIQGFPASVSSHLIAGTTNPLFIDTAAENYRLQPGSQCINAGSNDSIPSNIVVDLDLSPRIANVTIDMGAYELGSTPLPLDLISFSGKLLTNNSNLLQWQMSNVTPFSVELQRSIDGKSYNTIYGTIANGSSGTIQYSFTDNQPRVVNYYRLQMKDESAAMHFSDIVLIKVPNSSFGSKVYPNPANESINITIGDPGLLNTSVWITNIYGNLVSKIFIYKDTQKISLSNLTAGTYLLKTENGEVFKIEKR